MTLNEISIIRLNSQKLTATKFKKANEIVAWMGAVQAQDYSMAKWALSLRISDSSDRGIEESFNSGEIIRTHVMRPTWHFVSPEDLYWMIELTAGQIKSALKSREKSLELEKPVIVKSNKIIEKALAAVPYLSRDDLKLKLNARGIKTDNNRLSHILVGAEIDGLICSGPMKQNKVTYSLLSERVPVKKSLTRDESLTELARRYFNSHCPAALKDFQWWSGLSFKDSRLAWETIKSDFVTEDIGKEKYLIPNTYRFPDREKLSVHLLPAYDEFLISYKDRSASLSLVYNKKTISSNGVFNPVIILNGQVVGVWKRSVKMNDVIIQLNLFEACNESDRNLIRTKALKYADFLNKRLELRYGE